MLSSFDRAAKSTVSPTPANCLNRSDGKSPVTDDTVWIDLNFPTSEEDAETEKALGIEIPTRAEMRQIEASNRLYQDRGTYYMTAYVATGSDSDANSSSAVTFILAGDRLITVRYGEPKAWSIFLARVDKGDAGCRNGAEILCGLLESIVQVKADVIERIQDEVDKTARAIFDIKGGQQTRGNRLDALLRAIGREGDLTSRAQESATSIDRAAHFFGHAARERKDEQEILHRIDSIHRDLKSLSDHMGFLTARTSFLLDATLGSITIEQNKIIKLFSVMAVMLMPPTLVASIYGMNFKHMPELEWVEATRWHSR